MNVAATVRNVRLTLLQELGFYLPRSYVRLPSGQSIVFIHINKTGGTSVGKALGICPKEHATAQEIKWSLPRRWWKTATKFSVVRNPWDKAVSHYEYRVRHNAQGLGNRHLSFPEWVRLTYGDQAPPYYDRPKMFMPQVNWLQIDGKLGADVVLRFETLGVGFQNLARQLKLTCELPHLNATQRRPYREYYSTEAADVIGNWFRDDIKEFGYTFQ